MKKNINYIIKPSQKKSSYKLEKTKIKRLSKKINGKFCDKSGQCREVICEFAFCQYDNRQFFGNIKENFIF